VFRNWVLDEPAGHRWYRNQVVTLIDDHDQVRKGSNKGRFCGAWSTVAPTFRVEGDQFHLIYWYAPNHVAPPPSSLTVERTNGPLAVRMTLPAAGFAIYQAAPGLNRLGPSPPPDLKPWHPRAGRG